MTSETRKARYSVRECESPSFNDLTLAAQIEEGINDWVAYTHDGQDFAWGHTEAECRTNADASFAGVIFSLNKKRKNLTKEESSALDELADIAITLSQASK